MRCKACDVELSDFEATRKDKRNDFIDLCNYCYSSGSYDEDDSVRLDLVSDEDSYYENDSGSEGLTYGYNDI